MPSAVAMTAVQTNPAALSTATAGPMNPLSVIACGQRVDDRAQRVGEFRVAGALQVAGRADLGVRSEEGVDDGLLPRFEARVVDQLHRVVGRVGIAAPGSRAAASSSSRRGSRTAPAAPSTAARSARPRSSRRGLGHRVLRDDESVGVARLRRSTAAPTMPVTIETAPPASASSTAHTGGGGPRSTGSYGEPPGAGSPSTNVPAAKPTDDRSGSRAAAGSSDAGVDDRAASRSRPARCPPSTACVEFSGTLVAGVICRSAPPRARCRGSACALTSPNG